jgi:hypothetical protein
MSEDRINPERREGADNAATGHGHDFEAWLTAHPEANDELDDLRNLRGTFQSAWPAEPDASAWSVRLNRIASAGAGAHVAKKPAPRRPLWVAIGLMAAAAVVALLVARLWWTPALPPEPFEEPYPVAEADDVNIISIEAEDLPHLVVGEPPVSGELAFVRTEDVRVIKCKKCPKSGNMPHLETGEEVPMFVSTVARVDDPNDK